MQNYGILGCLREQYEDLSAACKEEVFKRQAEAANDWRTDKELNEACQVILTQAFVIISASQCLERSPGDARTPDAAPIIRASLRAPHETLKV